VGVGGGGGGAGGGGGRVQVLAQPQPESRKTHRQCLEAEGAFKLTALIIVTQKPNRAVGRKW